MISSWLSAALTRRNIHYGWVMVAVTFLTALITAGTVGAPGVFIVPLQHEFGWTTAEISSALSVRFILFGLMAPFAAALLNRYGLRNVTLVAQLIVVDQILVAQRDPEHPLTNHARHRVLDQIGRAVIGEAAGKPRHQPDRPFGGTQQHCPGLGGHLAAIESGDHRAPFNRYKPKQIRATLCPHRASPASETNRSCNTIFSDPGPRCTYPL